MTDDNHVIKTTMLGTYILEGNMPSEPDIVLVNSTDTTMLGQLISVFQNNPDIRFFLLHNIDENTVDLAGDFHFVKDGGNWVLANNNSILEVHFDNADFNPAGSESLFSIGQTSDGSWAISTEDIAAIADLPPSEHLLVDLAEDGILVDGSVAETTLDSESFFIDPSVLGHGENEIVFTNFTVGSDTLELPDGLSVKDVIVDTEHDVTELIIGQDNTTNDDIVVKLLGVSQPDLPMHEYGIDSDHATDDLINHLINSGMNVD